MELLRIGIWPTLGKPEWRLFCEPPVRVGGTGVCELCLRDAAICDFHAEFFWQKRSLILRDLTGKDEMRLNGEPLESAEIPPEFPASVEIGGYTLRPHLIALKKCNPHELSRLITELYMEKQNLLCLRVAGEACREFGHDAHLQALLALAELRRKNYENAEKAISKSQWLDGDDKALFLAKAWLLERRGDYEKAEHLLTECCALNKGEYLDSSALAGLLRRKIEMYAKIRQIRRENRQKVAENITRKRAETKIGAYTIHHLKPGQWDLVERCCDYLEDIARDVSQNLGFDPEDVVLDITGQGWKGKAWEAACFKDGVIYVSPEHLEHKEANAIAVTLGHEYIHLAVSRLSGGNCPAWLDEGLSQFITQNLAVRDDGILKEAFLKDSLLPFKALEKPFSCLEDDVLINLAYAQSYFFVEFLYQKIKIRGICGILAGIKEYGCLDQALDKWNYELNSLEEDWKVSHQKRWK